MRFAAGFLRGATLFVHCDQAWSVGEFVAYLNNTVYLFTPFEQACQQRGWRLFVLLPRSPKLNGVVERAQRTHTEAFDEVTRCALDLTTLNRKLQAWERIYNTVRPHQALGYLTPQQFLRQQRAQRGQTECH